MQEDTTRVGDEIAVNVDVVPGEFIRRRQEADHDVVALLNIEEVPRMHDDMGFIEDIEAILLDRPDRGRLREGSLRRRGDGRPGRGRDRRR